MQTHALLFCLVGLFSCIPGLNAYQCVGCLDRQNRCHGHGATWVERSGEYTFTYRCRFVQKNGYTEYRTEIIDAGCIGNGQMKKDGDLWFDQDRCASVSCSKSGSKEIIDAALEVHETGCRTGGSCRRNEEKWNENCSRFQCVVTGYKSWEKRLIGRDPRCIA